MSGCKPFLATANRLLEKKRGSISDSYVVEARRKYQMLNQRLMDLKEAGKLSSTNPSSIREDDIRSILEDFRSRSLDLGYQEKLMGLIEQVLTSAGNPVIARMRNEGYRFPKNPIKPIRALSEGNLEIIARAAEGLDGWRGEVADFLVWFYPYTGVRPSELRRAHLEDLDTRNWKFTVRHPKGEGHYGVKRQISVLPPARKKTLEYLEARRLHLEAIGFQADSWPLIPSVYNGVVKEYSSNNFRDIKQLVERRAGIEFKLKDFRSTCAQMIKARNKGPVEMATKQLGHSGPDTTYRFYAQLQSDAVFEELDRMFIAEGNSQQSKTIPSESNPDGKTFLIPGENISAG